MSNLKNGSTGDKDPWFKMMSLMNTQDRLERLWKKRDHEKEIWIAFFHPKAKNNDVIDIIVTFLGRLWYKDRVEKLFFKYECKRIRKIHFLEITSKYL